MDTETEDYEDIDGEEEVQEAPVHKKIVNKPTQKRTERKEVPVEEVIESRYVAYHRPEETGIVDRETNQIVGGDVLTILSEVLNKLNNIEISQA